MKIKTSQKYSLARHNLSIVCSHYICVEVLVMVVSKPTNKIADGKHGTMLFTENMSVAMI